MNRLPAAPTMPHDAADNATTGRIAIATPMTGEAEWLALREPLETGWLTHGPKVEGFERAFAARVGVRHALAASSCTTALHLALAALGIGPGDEVIVPSFTWVATANAVLYCGAVPVLCDVNPATQLMDIADAASRVTARTRAVIPVHLFGLCVDVDAVRAAMPASVTIVEDAACAAGATLRGRPAGALADIAVFSFHPRKSITTGEGGMVTTDDASLARRVATLRNHGASPADPGSGSAPPFLLPPIDVLGFNYRMTDLQGAIGLVQLGRLDALIDERAGWARWYCDALADLDWLSLPREPGDGRHAWQSFVVRVDPDRAPIQRNAVMQALDDSGIACRPGTHAIHMLDYYRRTFGLTDTMLPGARDCALNTMAIPLHNRMSGSDFRRVADALHALAGA
jgi:dTDP-4-amino-4,6-dideoxygalactose transaminase